MASFNRVILMGNLTKDPEVRYTPSGTAVGDLRVASSRRYRTADGENREETCFVGVTVWGRQAETCAEYLRKGSPLLLEGRLKYDEWEKDGQKISRISVVAERVQFLGAPRSSEPRDGGAPPRREQPPMRAPAAPSPEPAAPSPAPESSPASQPPAQDESFGDDDNLPF